MKLYLVRKQDKLLRVFSVAAADQAERCAATTGGDVVLAEVRPLRTEHLTKTRTGKDWRKNGQAKHI